MTFIIQSHSFLAHGPPKRVRSNGGAGANIPVSTGIHQQRTACGTELSALPAVLPRIQSGMASILPGIKRNAVTSTVLLAAVLIGFLLGRFTSSKRSAQRLSNAPENGTFAVDEETGALESAQEDGATPLWLNYALARMWALFQKNTKRLISDTIQPVLDETEKPPFVKAVRLTRFVPGRQSPFIRSLKRLPSRALAEVQYSLRTKFSSTSEFEFDLDVELFGGKFNATVPVFMKNLDMDALCWSSFALAPYDPFVTGVTYSLLEPPIMAFDLTVAGVLPITSFPVLRSFFFRLVTQEIPKEFLYPNTVFLDFTPEQIQAERRVLSSGRTPNAKVPLDVLQAEYPEQWALFDALDLDASGCLSGVELFTGLKDWGYTAEDASESFAKLDVNADNKITFPEFVEMWPKLAESFVPSKYKGTLTVFLRGGKNLQKPLVGRADPYVLFRLGKQELTSKIDSETSGAGERGNPIWMESFELNCEDITKEALEVEVHRGNRLAIGGGKDLGKAKIPLKPFDLKPNKRNLKLKLEPEGTLMMDLFYSDFVDVAN